MVLASQHFFEGLFLIIFYMYFKRIQTYPCQIRSRQRYAGLIRPSVILSENLGLILLYLVWNRSLITLITWSSRICNSLDLTIKYSRVYCLILHSFCSESYDTIFLLNIGLVKYDRLRMSCKSRLHPGIENHLKVAFGEDYLGIGWWKSSCHLSILLCCFDYPIMSTVIQCLMCSGLVLSVKTFVPHVTVFVEWYMVWFKGS